MVIWHVTPAYIGAIRIETNAGKSCKVSVYIVPLKNSQTSKMRLHSNAANIVAPHFVHFFSAYLYCFVDLTPKFEF